MEPAAEPAPPAEPPPSPPSDDAEAAAALRFAQRPGSARLLAHSPEHYELMASALAEADDPCGAARAQLRAGQRHEADGDLQRALANFASCTAAAAADGTLPTVAIASLAGLARCTYALGRIRDSLAHAKAWMSAAQAQGASFEAQHPWSRCDALLAIGRCCNALRDPRSAESAFCEALDELAAAGEREEARRRAQLEVDVQERPEFEEELAEQLEEMQFRDSNLSDRLRRATAGAAAACSALGSHAEAVRHFGALAELAHGLGDTDVAARATADSGRAEVLAGRHTAAAALFKESLQLQGAVVVLTLAVGGGGDVDLALQLGDASPRSGRERCEVALALGESLQLGGNTQQASKLFAETAAQSIEKDILAKAHLGHARVLAESGDTKAAETAFSKCIECAKAASAPKVMAVACGALGASLVADGEPSADAWGKAAEWHADQLNAAEEAADDAEIQTACRLLGICMLALSRDAEAVQLMDRLEQLQSDPFEL